MATATNPVQLKNVILSRLGAPVNTINVTDSQLFEAIDRAVDLYVDYHYDGINKMYLIKPITDADVAAGLIQLDVKLQAVSRVYRNTFSVGGAWSDGSVFDAGWQSGADLIKMMTGSGGADGTGLFSGGGYGLALYDAFQQNLELIQRFFTPDLNFWFNSDSGKLKILSEGNLTVGQIVIIECYVAAGVYVDQSYITQPDAATGLYITKANQNYHNPYAYTIGGTSANQADSAMYMTQSIYNNRWLKEMATAYTKQIWGSNLKKFNGQPLPGGITVNGQGIYDEANAEIAELRKELLLLQEPLPFYME